MIADRARRFVDEELIPRELAAEEAGGGCPPRTSRRSGRPALEAGLAGGLHAVEHGGQGWSHHAWALVEEQLGRSTNALSWHVPNAYNVWSVGIGGADRPLAAADAARRGAGRVRRHGGARGVGPVGDRDDRGAGDGGGWRIRGEKWFVTSGDVADVIIVVAGAPEGPTLFLVPTDAAGITVVEDPEFTHAYPHGHPTLRFDVEVGPDAVLGPLGGADDLQRAWFTEERLGIAARGIGAMERLLSETLALATGRSQGGARLWDHQGVAFPLADSAADAAAGRLLVLEVARLADAGADPKVVHAKASMAKLFVSEAACRCADRAVQAFGGRGYRRDNVAERFLRELRVDRIWEGTSEIQRLIIARSLERRGVAKVLR